MNWQKVIEALRKEGSYYSEQAVKSYSDVYVGYFAAACVMHGISTALAEGLTGGENDNDTTMGDRLGNRRTDQSD